MFDEGTIKLADFGLSKSLPVNKHASYDLDSKFKLTGETGSYRYMAPEVFRHECYNFKARLVLWRGGHDEKAIQRVVGAVLKAVVQDGHAEH